jgi:hypothetical protein
LTLGVSHEQALTWTNMAATTAANAPITVTFRAGWIGLYHPRIS